MTIKKNYPQLTQILFLVCVTCVICGPAYGQTNSDRWIDYAPVDYDIFPNVTYAKASNFELKLDLYVPKNRSRPNATFVNWFGIGDVADLPEGPNARNYAREWFGTVPKRRSGCESTLAG